MTENVLVTLFVTPSTNVLSIIKFFQLRNKLLDRIRRKLLGYLLSEKYQLTLTLKAKVTIRRTSTW